MSSTKREFLSSEEASLLRVELQKMVDDPQYNTTSRYSMLPEGRSEFVQRHIDYMSNYPSMNHFQYVLNLKLMTKLK